MPNVSYKEFDPITRRSKVVHSIGFGVLARPLPPLAPVVKESKDMRPPKHPAGFCERYF